MFLKIIVLPTYLAYLFVRPFMPFLKLSFKQWINASTDTTLMYGTMLWCILIAYIWLFIFIL